MNTVKIFSRNADYQQLDALKTNRNKRYSRRVFLTEGVRNINEAVRNGWEIVSFVYPSGRPLSAWAGDLLKNVPSETNYALAGDLMNELSGKGDTSELLALIRMREEKRDIAFSKNPVMALADRPSNKGNLGTLLRSCDALGVEGLIITGHATDIYDPEVIVSSMGSFFNVPFIKISDNADIDGYVDGLREKYPGLTVIGTSARGQKNIYEINMTGPVLFCIGNETNGLNRHLSERCDTLAKIPMSARSSASSLNISCAATVMFYEAARQRATAASASRLGNS